MSERLAENMASSPVTPASLEGGTPSPTGTDEPATRQVQYTSLRTSPERASFQDLLVRLRAYVHTNAQVEARCDSA